MYVIFVVFTLLAGGDAVDYGVSKQTFDTLEACQAEMPAIVERANTELAENGAKISSSECITTDELKKKVFPQ